MEINIKPVKIIKSKEEFYKIKDKNSDMLYMAVGRGSAKSYSQILEWANSQDEPLRSKLLKEYSNMYDYK